MTTALKPLGFTRTLVREGDRVLISSECTRCHTKVLANYDDLDEKETCHRESCPNRPHKKK